MRQSKSVRLLNAQDIKRNLERMAREIVLQAFDALGFIGIRTRGLFWPSDWVRSSRSHGKGAPWRNGHQSLPR